MRILPADTNGLNVALRILRDGGVVAHATETCYGFACDLRSPDAVTKLFKIKQRPLDQPVSALFSSLDQAKEYVEWNEEAETLARKHLPGPLTLILPQKNVASCELRVAGNLETRNSQLEISIGVRLSSHPLAQILVREFGSPLSTTSANIHNTPNPYSAEEIVKQFEGWGFQPDLILDSGALAPNPPSTVMDLTRRDVRLLRRGTVDNEKK